VEKSVFEGPDPTFEAVNGFAPQNTTGARFDVTPGGGHDWSVSIPVVVVNCLFRFLGAPTGNAPEGAGLVFGPRLHRMAVEIANNTFVWPWGRGITFWMWVDLADEAATLAVVNNLFQGTEIPALVAPTAGALADRGAVHFWGNQPPPADHPLPGTVIENNLFGDWREDRRIFQGSLFAPVDLFPQYPTNTTAPAMLSSLGPPLVGGPASYRPLAISPAMDASIPFSGVVFPSQDIDSQPRWQAPELGAFERPP
jgi:hypothetical protein